MNDLFDNNNKSIKVSSMKTEFQGDFKGYFFRCKFPGKRCFSMPLKSAGFIFLIELVMSCVCILIASSNVVVVLMLISCLLAIGYYIGVLYKDFWNIVLNESKGFLPDMMMWVYYMTVCAISLLPAFAVFYLSEL